MKIPLTITHGIATVIASLRAPSYHIYGAIEFIIDTGSTETFISEGHALQLQIPIRSLEFDKVSYGLGGASFNLYKLRDAILSFKTAEGKVEKFELKSIGVAETTAKRDERTRRISLGALSVLGTDFLIKNKLKLFLDFVNGIGYLENFS
jgi:hypothetical protein